MDKLMGFIRSFTTEPKYTWLSPVEIFSLNGLVVSYFQINSLITKINHAQVWYCTELVLN